MASKTKPTKAARKKPPVGKVVHLSSRIVGGCKHCQASIGGTDGDLAGPINHYIEAHGYELRHVGQQSERFEDGRQLYHSTVAVLWTASPPPERELRLVKLPAKDLE